MDIKKIFKRSYKLLRDRKSLTMNSTFWMKDKNKLFIVDRTGIKAKNNQTGVTFFLKFRG